MSKILLVEDDNNLREIYGARLEAEGYDIVTAGDGEEALATAVRERPDLIISDVMMPKISGFDMLDILRSTPETKDVKVIVMTALSQDEDRRRGEQLGADRYVVKSQVTLDDVVAMVREILPDTSSASPSVVADNTASDPAMQQSSVDPIAPQDSDIPVSQAPQPAQVASDGQNQGTNPQNLSPAVPAADETALVREVEDFVANSPLMNGVAPQPAAQPPQTTADNTTPPTQNDVNPAGSVPIQNG